MIGLRPARTRPDPDDPDENLALGVSGTFSSDDQLAVSAAPVVIEPILQLQSPQNGNFQTVGRRLSGVRRCAGSITLAGDIPECAKARQLPAFLAKSGNLAKRPDWLAGWRRSEVRAGLRRISLQTGNFTGKSAIFGDWSLGIVKETAVFQARPRKFPM